MKMKKSIPNFETLEDESDFWDKQELTEFFKGEELSVETTNTMRGVVLLRFSERILSEIRQLAKQYGVGYQNLIQTWVLERLKEESSAKAKSSKIRDRK